MLLMCRSLVSEVRGHALEVARKHCGADIAAQPYVAALAAGANAAQQHVQRNAVPVVTSVQAPRRTSALLQVQCDPTRDPLGAPAGTSDALLPRSECVQLPVALWQALYDSAASV